MDETANFDRLRRLLEDKGTEALRMCFDAIHPPDDLRRVLNANRESLEIDTPRPLLNSSQIDLLFPPADKLPDSKNFDLTLFCILFRNICGYNLSPPASSFDMLPSCRDQSKEADIIRLEFFSNMFYAGSVKTQVDEKTFDDYWQEISSSLVRLGIPQEEIEFMKTTNESGKFCLYFIFTAMKLLFDSATGCIK